MSDIMLYEGGACWLHGCFQDGCPTQQQQLKETLGMVTAVFFFPLCSSLALEKKRIMEGGGGGVKCVHVLGEEEEEEEEWAVKSAQKREHGVCVFMCVCAEKKRG